MEHLIIVAGKRSILSHTWLTEWPGLRYFLQSTWKAHVRHSSSSLFYFQLSFFFARDVCYRRSYTKLNCISCVLQTDIYDSKSTKVVLRIQITVGNNFITLLEEVLHLQSGWWQILCHVQHSSRIQPYKEIAHFIVLKNCDVDRLLEEM